jgi:hypothetical protein
MRSRTMARPFHRRTASASSRRLPHRLPVYTLSVASGLPFRQIAGFTRTAAGRTGTAPFHRRWVAGPGTRKSPAERSRERDADALSGDPERSGLVVEDGEFFHCLPPMPVRSGGIRRSMASKSIRRDRGHCRCGRNPSSEAGSCWTPHRPVADATVHRYGSVESARSRSPIPGCALHRYQPMPAAAIRLPAATLIHASSASSGVKTSATAA